jgi:hypothetical protein
LIAKKRYMYVEEERGRAMAITSTLFENAFSN